MDTNGRRALRAHARNAAIVASLLLVSPAALHAAPFTVTNLNDSGAGSLRDAIAQANAAPGPDTITFGVTGVISLIGSIVINDALTITGPDGEGALRLGACGGSSNLVAGGLHASTYAFDSVANRYIYFFTSTANDGRTRSSW